LRAFRSSAQPHVNQRHSHVLDFFYVFRFDPHRGQSQLRTMKTSSISSAAGQRSIIYPSRLLLGGTPACSSDFNVPRPRPQNDSEGNVQRQASSCISSEIDSGIQPRAPTIMFIIVPLPVFSFLCPSVLHSSSSSIHPLLLPHTLLPLLLSSTSAYYLHRRALPPSKIELNGHFGSALDVSVSLRNPTANIHDKKYYIHDMYSSLD